MGGTFDPPTLGHINAALAVARRFERPVYLMPNQHSPLKTASDTLADHRRAMLELAVAPHPELLLEWVEWSLPSPSATVQTLRHLPVAAAPMA